jgi:hypothetical protein
MFSIGLSHRISRRTELAVDLDIKAGLMSDTLEEFFDPVV